MKHLLTIATCLAAASIITTSCDKELKGEANVSYHSTPSSIVFSDPADSVYTTYIYKSLNDLGYTLNPGYDSIPKYNFIKESATTNTGQGMDAIAMCNAQALNTYSKKYASLTLLQIKENIYKNCLKDTLINKFDSYTDIDLDPFVLYYKVYSDMGYGVEIEPSISKKVQIQ